MGFSYTNTEYHSGMIYFTGYDFNNSTSHGIHGSNTYHTLDMPSFSVQTYQMVVMMSLGRYGCL